MSRDETPELQGDGGKLRYLLDDPVPQAVSERKSGQKVTSFPTLAVAVGQASHTAFLQNPLSAPNEARISELYCIPIESECWGEFKAGSCADFVQEYAQLAAAILARPDEKPPAPPRDTSAPLMQGEDRDPERCPIRGLASLELKCGQTQPGQTGIGALISCGISPVEGSTFPITVHTAQLEIDCGKARAAEATIKGLREPGFEIEGSKGKVRGMWNGGDAQRLTWLLDATSASLGVVEFEPGALARIERMAPGDVVTGTLGTWLKNINADEAAARTVDEIAVVDRLGNAVEIAEADLSILQLRIMEHLRKRVLAIDDDGYAILSRHELQFVRRP